MTAKSTLLTVKEIPAAVRRAVKSGRDVWLTDPAARGKGRLVCRCTTAGSAILMFRYTAPDGARQIIRIGSYDAEGRAGMTLDQARDEAGRLAKKYQAGTGHLREELQEEAEAKAAAKAASILAKTEADKRARRGSLSALIDTYVGTLEGRESQYDAKSVLRLHVQEAFPDLVALPAASIESKQLREVLARLVTAGKGRTAAKARAYLRAAYSLAMRADSDPTLPEALTAFDVNANPLERLPSLSQYSKALDRALSHAELIAFWKRVKALPPGPSKDALCACILLGGQRPTQLLRVTAVDVDLSGGTITLNDIKGRNRHTNPRRHVLPIPDDLMPIITRRHEGLKADEPLFGSTHKQTLSDLVTQISAVMLEASELERGAFQMRDIRRTAETHLAALGVSSDVRAQIQSHGLGGIQQRHYDRHDYMPEKRAALALWGQRLRSRVPAKLESKSRKAGS